MLDDIRTDDGLNLDGQKRERRRDHQRPLADREVPLAPNETEPRVLSPAVHAWLDANRDFGGLASSNRGRHTPPSTNGREAH